MKKMIALLLAVCVMCSMLIVTVSAAEPKSMMRVEAPERNLLPPEDTFLSCTDTVQGLHRIFLEAALFLLCAAGSLQEHVCRVYPAFSSAYFGAELLNSNGAFSGSSAASTSDLDSSA